MRQVGSRALRLAASEGASVTLLPLIGAADVFYHRGDYEKSLQIVSLVLLYPRNYIAIVEQRAQKMLNKLKEKMSNQVISTSLLQSKSLVLQKVVADVLASN